jgi:hypothetical protein
MRLARPHKTTPLCALRRALAVCTLFAFAAFIQAQDLKPEAKLDKDQILIGQQAQLELGVSYRADQGTPASIIWPSLTDTLSGHIDIVKDSGVDTILPDAQSDPYHFRQTRTLTITSWDSGYWAIPPVRFVINGDTAETAALLLTVNTVQVDTTQAIKDIKEIYEVPFSWMDWLRENWPWVAGGAVLAAILVALIRFLVLRSRKPREVKVTIPVLKPMHVRALEALEAINRKNMWQQGLTKEYQSEVTDILRAYIEERFNVPAMESTTDELLASLRLSEMNAGQREQLANMLHMADMVKFAKWTPLPAENEQLMAGAIKLVQQTAPQPSDEARA